MTRKQKYVMWLLLGKHIWIAIWVSENSLNVAVRMNFIGAVYIKHTKENTSNPKWNF